MFVCLYQEYVHCSYIVRPAIRIKVIDYESHDTTKHEIDRPFVLGLILV